MSIQIVGKDVEAEVEESVIELNRRRVGFLKDYGFRPNGHQYHVGLYVAPGELDSSDGLVQGFGDSVNAAMDDAFARGRKIANLTLEGIEKMETEIGASQAEEEING
jgi:hypothetical protein